MNRPSLLLLVAVLLAAAAAIIHGPIPQFPHYHDFADQSRWLGLPHPADLLSNLGFLAVGVYGWASLRRHRSHPALVAGWPGYRLFLLGLTLTAVGSMAYHWAPDNTRLVWDRMPIALACSGLLAAVWNEADPRGDGPARAALLALAGVGSVAWWYFTDRNGSGDLRCYLLLQGLPLVLVPLWQSMFRPAIAERLGFGIALLLYALAKGAEVCDHEIFAATGGISGHTLKHVMAAIAAVVIVRVLVGRLHTVDRVTSGRHPPLHPAVLGTTGR